ncbi:MAG: hypothetical protein WC238_03225 [Parcubacteria group bacterium]|jgi:hypothetical protein
MNKKKVKVDEEKRSQKIVLHEGMRHKVEAWNIESGIVILSGEITHTTERGWRYFGNVPLIQIVIDAAMALDENDKDIFFYNTFVLLPLLEHIPDFRQMLQNKLSAIIGEINAGLTMELEEPATRAIIIRGIEGFLKRLEGFSNGYSVVVQAKEVMAGILLDEASVEKARMILRAFGRPARGKDPVLLLAKAFRAVTDLDHQQKGDPEKARETLKILGKIPRDEMVFWVNIEYLN